MPFRGRREGANGGCLPARANVIRMAQFGSEGSRSIAQASARGKVKWFNGTKGYGFITLDNGGDAFCPASALQSAGQSEVQPGTTRVCDLADSPRGMKVVTVHSVDTSTAEAPSRGPRREGGGGGF